jgi:hypothetical protein
MAVGLGRNADLSIMLHCTAFITVQRRERSRMEMPGIAYILRLTPMFIDPHATWHGSTLNGIHRHE